MSFLEIVVVVVFIVSAVLLILIVLAQEEGGDGLGGIFGGGSNQVGNRSGNILTRITSVLGTLFLVCAFGLAWVSRTTDEDNVESVARQLEGSQEVEWWDLEDIENIPAEGTEESFNLDSLVQPATSTAEFEPLIDLEVLQEDGEGVEENG